MEWAACEKCAQRCEKKAEIRPAKSMDSSRADGKDRYKKPENERLQKDALISGEKFRNRKEGENKHE